MTRKHWINSISNEEASKIHVTFRNFDKELSKLPIAPVVKGPQKNSFVDFMQERRTAVRNFLRTNRLNPRLLNIQYGRLAAGLPIKLDFARP